MKRALAFIVAAVCVLTFEYAFIVWLGEPYECVNCDPE